MWLLQLVVAIIISTQTAVVCLNYQPSTLELSPEDELCGFLVQHCPFLRSTLARPVDHYSTPVEIAMKWELKRFLGINDLLQTLSFMGALRVHWKMPTCAQWFGLSFAKFNLSQVAQKTSICQFSLKSEIWHPKLFLANSYDSMYIFEKYEISQLVYFG